MTQTQSQPRVLAALFVSLCALFGLSCTGDTAKNVAADANGSKPDMQNSLSEPITHENLTIYLVTGPSTLKGEYLTLEEAMNGKTIRVHETDNVNELAVENVGDVAVFIQSGDIVKGGKQDRTIATDFVLPAKSGKVGVDAFCVERGRWAQRGGESAALFSSSGNYITGRQLKLASNSNYSGGGQQDVWREVSSNQDKLRSNLGVDVAAETSPSSLQLTLENKDVQQAVERYVKALADAPGLRRAQSSRGEQDVIGYAAVINGKLNCADVYGSGDLFAKVWPRVLKSLATEAAAEMQPGAAPAKPLTTSEVEAAMRAAQNGSRKENKLAKDVTVITYDSHDSVLFECRTAGEPGFLRQSILATEPAEKLQTNGR